MKNIRIYIILLILLSSCKYDLAENSLFILPEDYQGMILVVYDVENGKEVEYNENGTRIYRVPNTGILETKFKQNKGVSELPRFIYENSKKELHYMMPSDWENEKYKNSSEIIVAGMTTGNNKKPFLSATVKAMNNDSVGNNIHRKRMNYFKERKFIKE